MQLKSTFSFNKIVYPILILRNSVLIANDTISKKVNSLGFEIKDFFYDDVDLHKMYVSRTSDVDVNIETILRTGASLENVETNTKLFEKILIGKIPIMINSRYCNIQHQTSKENCTIDPGGYFIIGGSEKVIISQ